MSELLNMAGGHHVIGRTNNTRRAAGDSPIKYIQNECELDCPGEAMHIRRGGTGCVGGGK
jgi:hypothetical protein